jgi:hypothetical protein
MSKNNNVNPGQYKVAGRERPGKDIPEPERARGSASGARTGSKSRTPRKNSSRSSSGSR